jgi:hypothetical protein
MRVELTTVEQRQAQARAILDAAFGEISRPGHDE